MVLVNYIAQNPHMTQSAARGVVQGREMLVTVDAFEVELVAELASNGGVKLRFIGDQIQAAQELFAVDAPISAVFGRSPEMAELAAPKPEAAPSA